MANTTPASGVLNAAAIPAAPPASRKWPAWRGSRKPSARPITYIRLAPTCTVGPSRPTDAPPSKASTVSPSLPADTGSDRLRWRNSASGLSNAAITCGMPLPRVGLSAPWVSQANRPNTAGVSSSGHHGEAS